MNWKNSLKYKKIIVFLFIAMFLPLFLLLSFREKVATMLNYEVEMGLVELTKQNSILLEGKIKATFSFLHTMSNLITKSAIGREEIGEKDNLINFLKEEFQNNNFTRFGILDTQGRAIYGFDVDFRNMKYLEESLQGESKVTYVPCTPFLDLHSMVFSVPIYAENNKIIGVLYAIYGIEDLKKFFSFSFFDGKGDCFILNQSGNLLIPVKDNEKNDRLRDYFHHWQEKTEVEDNNLHKFILTLRDEQQAVGKIQLKGLGEQYIACVPLGNINGIYTVSSVPADFITKRIANILFLVTMVLLISLLILFCILIYIEIIENKNRKNVYRLAYIDQLTNLGNFEKMKLDKEITKKNNKGKYILAVVDIDKFKLINEMMSYQYGSELLTFVASKLDTALIENEYVYRLGNDLFGLLLISKEKEESLTRLTQLFDEISEYYNHKHALTFSCGIYQIGKHDFDLAKCIDNANIARLAGKNYSNNSFIYFDDKMLIKMREIKEFEDGLQQAIEEKQFEIYLQPKYKVRPPRHLGGAEALVRWIHPTKGMISPAKFIPVFEQNGTIKYLDMYVFEAVCRQMRIWLNQGITLVPISVNISRLTLLGQSNFIERIEAVAQKYNIAHSLLELEILESVSFNNGEGLTGFLKKIKNRGFKISIDDFGSGYSSLGLLKNMPIDTLKIDRSFFSDWQREVYTVEETKEKSIVRSIIEMAQGLNLNTVAEGIEEEYQVEFLTNVGCDLIQGYYFSKPLPVEAFEKLLKNKE